MNSLFNLGQVCATPGALELIGDDIDTLVPGLVGRHAMGDWGDVCKEDAGRNEDAVFNGARIFSVYAVNGERIWIITEADRSLTTLLLPEEY